MKGGHSSVTMHKAGITRIEVAVIIFVMIALFCLLGLAAQTWKKKSDRSATILSIRNCQQAMRGHQGMNSLITGDPFTVRDLEKYMSFPENIGVLGGSIDFDPGLEKVTGMSGDPAINGDHLWLRVEAPNTKGNVGDYGFDDITETSGW